MPGLNSAAHPLRVLMLSKALVTGAYQRKLEEIAALPGISLVALVPATWESQRLERVYTQGYQMLEVPLRFNGSFHLHHYPGLSRLMGSLRPHIVHIDEEPYNLATYLAMRAARRVGAKVIFFSWQNLNRGYPPPFAWMERAVLRHADYAIVGNREAEGVWRAKGYQGPLAVIPQFGVDPAVFCPPEQPETRPRFVIGYAGRLVPEKGVDTLIHAAALLPGSWLLRIAGSGPEERSLSHVAGLLNIGGGVEFVPPIPSTQMPAFYQGLDVLVLPSRTMPNWKEQFGRVLVEAMACGVPVIGAATGAIPEVIGDTGLLFPEGDQHALRDQLLRLMADPTLRRALGLAGRRRVLEHFTQAHIAARTVEVYRALCP